MSHPKAVRDHEIRDLGQCRVASDTGRRQRPIQGRAPARPLSGRILPLEFEEPLQSWQDGPDGVAKRIGGSSVLARVHEGEV